MNSSNSINDISNSKIVSHATLANNKIFLIVQNRELLVFDLVDLSTCFFSYSFDNCISNLNIFESNCNGSVICIAATGSTDLLYFDFRLTRNPNYELVTFSFPLETLVFDAEEPDLGIASGSRADGLVERFLLVWRKEQYGRLISFVDILPTDLFLDAHNVTYFHFPFLRTDSDEPDLLGIFKSLGPLQTLPKSKIKAAAWAIIDLIARLIQMNSRYEIVDLEPRFIDPFERLGSIVAQSSFLFVAEYLLRRYPEEWRVDQARFCLEQSKSLAHLWQWRTLEAALAPYVANANQLAVYLCFNMIKEVEDKLLQDKSDPQARVFLARVCGRDLDALNYADSSYAVGKRSCYYNFGKSLIDDGDFVGALTAFEKAQSSPLVIEQVLETGGSDMEKQYRASNPGFEIQLQSLRTPGLTADYTAGCKLARRPEDAATAVKHFSTHKFVDKAVELAIEANLYSELIQTALVCENPHSLFRAAAVFESHPENRFASQAALLYDKAGAQTRAIKICIENKLYSQLESLLSHVRLDCVSEKLLKKCENFLQVVKSV